MLDLAGVNHTRRRVVGRFELAGMSEMATEVELKEEHPAVFSRARPLIGHHADISTIAISPESRWIVPTSDDKTARVWQWQWDDLVALAGKLGRNLDRKEWKLYFRDEPYRKTFPALPVPGDP